MKYCRSNFIVGLEFVQPRMLPASAHVYVKAWSKNPGIASGAPVLTPHLANERELDYYLDRMQKEIEMIRRQGHAAFKKQRTRS